MRVQEALPFYGRLSAALQAQLLVRFGYELTLRARETYVVGGDDLVDPILMRRCNELTHRVLDHSDALLAGRLERRPDEVTVRMLLEPGLGRIQEIAVGAFDAAVKAVPGLT